MTLLDIEAKIELTRAILNNAIESDANYNTILEISQKLDEYIVRYLNSKKCKGEKNSDAVPEKGNC